MPQWIHDRASHIQAKNPGMEESTAFAVATQQAHAVGKSPKGFGTSAGRSEAKEKYDTPKDDKKTADPGGIGKEAKMIDLRPHMSDEDAVEVQKNSDMYKHPFGAKQHLFETIDPSSAAKQRVAESRHVNRWLARHPEVEKTAEVTLLAPFMTSFADEIEKIANLSGQSDLANPTQIGVIKTPPMKNLSKPGQVPRYSNVNSGTSTSPIAQHQPMLAAPSVKT